MTMLRAFVYFMLAGSCSAVYDIRGHLVCKGSDQITFDDADTDAWVELQYMERGSTGSGWKRITGSLKQVSVGDNKIMGINTHGKMYYRTNVNAPYPEGTSWREIDGKFAYVTVGDGKIMGLDSEYKVIFRTGVTSSTPYGTGWETVAGGILKQFSIGDGKIIGVNKEDKIYYRKGIDESHPYGTGTWVRLDGKLKHIAIGDGRIMGVNMHNTIYVRIGVNESKPLGSSWQELNGALVELSIADGKIMGVNSAGDCYFIEGLDLSQPDKVRWRKTGDIRKHISIGDRKYVSLTEKDEIYFRTGYEDKPQASCSSFLVGGDVDMANTIFMGYAKGTRCINLCIDKKKYVPSIEAVSVTHPKSTRKDDYMCYCITKTPSITRNDSSTCTLKYNEEEMKVKRTTNDERVSRNGRQMHSVSNDDNYIHLEGAAGRTDSALLLMVKVTNYKCERVRTEGGNANGADCTFPFTYDGIKYFACTLSLTSFKQWCATTSDYSVDGKWGNCIDKETNIASGKRWTDDKEGNYIAKYVDFGRLIFVDRIEVNYVGRVGQHYNNRLIVIQTRLNDNGIWDLCNSFIQKGYISKDIRCTKTTVAAFVRLFHNSTESLTGFNIKVYEGRPNAALKRATITDFKYLSHSEDRAVDGNYDTYFMSLDRNFWMVDLKELITIDKIILYLNRTFYQEYSYKYMKILTNQWNLASWTLCNEVGKELEFHPKLPEIQRSEVRCGRKSRTRAVKIENGYGPYLSLNEVEILEDAMWFYPPYDCFGTLTPKFGCKDLTFNLKNGVVSKQKWTGRKAHEEVEAEAAEAELGELGSKPAYYNITNPMLAGPLYAGLDDVSHADTTPLSKRARHGRVLSGNLYRDTEYETIYNNGNVLMWQIVKWPAAGKSSRDNDYYKIISKDTNGTLHASSFNISKWYSGSIDHYAQVNKIANPTVTDRDLWEIVKGDDAYYTIINKAFDKPFFAVVSDSHYTRVSDPTAVYIPDGSEKWYIVRS